LVIPDIIGISKDFFHGYTVLSNVKFLSIKCRPFSAILSRSMQPGALFTFLAIHFSELSSLIKPVSSPLLICGIVTPDLRALRSPNHGFDHVGSPSVQEGKTISRNGVKIFCEVLGGDQGEEIDTDSQRFRF